MLIKSYGLYWNPDIVDWGSRGRHKKGTFLGKVKLKKNTHEIDFWAALSSVCMCSLSPDMWRQPYPTQRRQRIPTSR